MKIDCKLSFLNNVKCRADLEYANARRLYPILRYRSKLSVHSRLVILKSILEHIAFYGVELVLGGSALALKKLETVQHVLRSNVIEAPFYVRNVDIENEQQTSLLLHTVSCI